MLTIDGRSQRDNDATDACVNGTEGILNLGQHATTDGAISLVAFEVGVSNDGNDTLVVIGVAQHSLLFK